MPVNADKNSKFYFNVERYYGKGTVYFDQGCREWDKGNLQGARQAFDSAAQADPKMWPAWFALAEVELQLGRYDAALQDCNQAGRLKPQFKRTFVVRAQVYQALGRCGDGLADLDRVISLHGNDEVDAFALSSRAWLRATCRDSTVRDPKKAVDDATRACKLTGWHMADYIGTLSLAYAANGDFDSAIRYQKLAIDSGKLLPGELKRAQQRLEFYQRHQGP